ncbi:ATP-dependent 6-phosphofructokinase-like isoform X2 [Biomphalaria glabrata]|uniref:6-phosphofructokinase n=1 Tax=Biomphalaria glabrata TaxID=6526 RepID=A0A9W3B804_BIOGL|nr:ATP-dependent 6-phosphofructokinase-like isoform X2 [Biomphalaria glabrata]
MDSVLSPKHIASEEFSLSNLEAAASYPSGLFNVSSYQPKPRSSKSIRNSWVGSVIGIVTAGDDAQGMNSAISAVVKMAYYLGSTVFYIKNGFRGMVEGDDNYVMATWYSTMNIVGKGGTTIKTFKCPEFADRSARLKAAKNLVEHGILKIIAIGGDGTLKGIWALYNDWLSLLRELDDRDMVNRTLLQSSRRLRVVGIVSSIVNDVCGTDMSIGANSATQRILETLDAIMTNASSSQTAFIVEVMGKTSGYLTLASGVACDASMIFLPEWPPQGDWKEELCNKVRDDLLIRQQGLMIIKSEGATDVQGQPITAEEISKVLREKLKIISQITVLGHFQCLLSSYVLLHSMRSSPVSSMAILAGIRRVGIIQVGMDTLGQCIVCKAFVGYCQSRGYAVIGIKDGFEGLLRRQFISLSWDIVKNWTSENDCLGSGKQAAEHYQLDSLDAAVNELNICGLILLGSFSAYESLCTLYEARLQYKNLGIPMCMVPTGILNNVPGSDITVGCDSALNEYVTYCDKMTRVAHASKNYVYVIETMCENAGYLTTLAAVCSEADAAYISLEPFTLNDLLKDADHVKRKIQQSGCRSALILIGTNSSEFYNTDFVRQLFAEEGKGVFSCKKGVMGHVQLGGHISVWDRQNAIIHGFRAGEWLLNYVDNVPVSPEGILYDPGPNAKVVLSVSKRNIKFKTIARLICETDFGTQNPTFNWWMKLRPLLRVMAQHFDVEYELEISDDTSAVSDVEDTNMYDMLNEQHKHSHG